jgi:predicted ribosome quality control (RQC) complex YloA/Tae2 family protein
VSNAIRYDSLLVRELARELNGLLAGARLEAALLDRQRLRFTLLTSAARRGRDEPPSLLWQLHPTAGHLTAAPVQDAAAGRSEARPVPTQGRSPIARVHAPPDERLLILELQPATAPAGMARRIIIELITNQWNVVATGADGRVVAVLRERETQTRVLRTGMDYVAPRASARTGAGRPLTVDEWQAALLPVPPADRLSMLLRFAAYASPLNAAWILGEAGVSSGAAPLDHAFERYRALVEAERLVPVLRRSGPGGLQPYVAVAGSMTADEESAPSLLVGFERAAAAAAALPHASETAAADLALIEERLAAVRLRARRLEAQRAGASGEAARLRVAADLLLSQLQRVPRGADRVLLDDFAGGTLELELDPALGGADNARSLYDRARKRDRAAARVPALLVATRAEQQRLERLAERIRTGTASAAELERLRTLPPVSARDGSAALPYRVYRTSGGLEVRVGRGSKANDDLTFRHSSPNDIWLHAREVAGAHVILRWPRADANPAARDIAEAACLAAVFSRARTSGIVPVDWTRRKYVRKPRKSGPGRVLPERVRTVFVQPDAELAERLRISDTIG